MNSRTLYKTDLNQAFKLVYLTSIKFLVLTPVSLLLSLVYRLLENRILWTRWWLATTTTMVGKHINAKGLPITILFDKNGKEIGRYNGDFEWDSKEVIKFITKLKNS